jgi:hypothetical protein
LEPLAPLPSQLDDFGGQPLFIVAAARDFALRRAVLPELRTGATRNSVKEACFAPLRKPQAK